MQMHIINEGKQNEDSFSDHTRIINKIVKSIKIYNWKFILSSLPPGSILVGGYIRDVILERLSNHVDIDIVVPENSITIGKKISQNFNGRFIILDKEREVVRIIFKTISIDIASQISKSLTYDLISRDFSINSIAYSFEKNLLIDPLNGMKDIEKGLLRTNSKENLLNDPLRILRCFRFVSELDFTLEERLIDFIKKYNHKLSMVAKERINYELQSIIRGQKAKKSICLIKEFQIFNFIQSEVNLITTDFEKIDFDMLNQNEKKEFLPLFFLIQIFDEVSLKKFLFSKSEILNAKLLIKWLLILNKKNIVDLNENERFDLHQELEPILPCFIFYLPETLQLEWLKRWRDSNDKLFHPSNLIKGSAIKNYLKIKEGPLFGKLIRYLSVEIAFDRLHNFDQTIYKAKQWIQQNAPKCD